MHVLLRNIFDSMEAFCITFIHRFFLLFQSFSVGFCGDLVTKSYGEAVENDSNESFEQKRKLSQALGKNQLEAFIKVSQSFQNAHFFESS